MHGVDLQDSMQWRERLDGHSHREGPSVAKIASKRQLIIGHFIGLVKIPMAELVALIVDTEGRS
jgi:hypothetical protein